MSEFDPDVFLDAATKEAGTKRPLLPNGDYVATVKELKYQTGQQKKDPTKTWHAFNTQLEVDLSSYPMAMQVVGQPKVVLFDFVGFDVRPDGKSLDWSPGKNRRLTAYREATGLNVPGEAFSPRQLIGRMVLVKVGRDMYNGEEQESVDGIAQAA